MVDEQNPYADFNDLGTRLNELEEKQRLLKDRILLIGENLISTKEDLIKLESETKKQLQQTTSDLATIKRLLARVISELNNSARKSEVEILDRQLKMFQPLEFARIADIKEIIQEELNKTIKREKS
ncbi:MAG: hypothetical protein WC438_02085 [Candidatus Pacearchaeota archaeon]